MTDGSRRTREIAAPAQSSSTTRSLAQATDVRRREEPGLDSVPLRRRADAGLLQPLEGAALAKEAGFPVYTSRSARRRASSSAARSAVPGHPQDRQVIPVPPDPETLRAIAETTGGEFSEARTADALSARTRTWARGSAASPVRARSRGSSSRSRPRSCCSRGRSARSSRRASLDQTATIVNGRSARSSRPAGCIDTRNAPPDRPARRVGVVRSRLRPRSRRSSRRTAPRRRLSRRGAPAPPCRCS